MNLHDLANDLTQRYSGRGGIVAVTSVRRQRRLIVDVKGKPTEERELLLRELRARAEGVAVTVRRQHGVSGVPTAAVRGAATVRKITSTKHLVVLLQRGHPVLVSS